MGTKITGIFHFPFFVLFLPCLLVVSVKKSFTDYLYNVLLLNLL